MIKVNGRQDFVPNLHHCTQLLEQMGYNLTRVMVGVMERLFQRSIWQTINNRWRCLQNL